MHLMGGQRMLIYQPKTRLGLSDWRACKYRGGRDGTENSKGPW